MTPTILVTGASSALGDHVVPALLANHCRVVATARSPEASARLRHAGVDVVHADLEHLETLPDIEASVMLHLAGIRFADAAIQLARAAGVERVIAISSASAVTAGHPDRDQVLRGEDLIQGAAPNATVLRPTMIYGSSRERNVQRLYRMCLRIRRVPRFTGGGQVMPVFVDDVVAAISEMLSNQRHGVFPLGGPAPVSFGRIVDEVCGAAQLPRLPVVVSVKALVRLAALAGGGRGKAVHAMQMLSTDRVVPAPVDAGFAFASTPLHVGVAAAVHRYQRPVGST